MKQPKLLCLCLPFLALAAPVALAGDDEGLDIHRISFWRQIPTDPTTTPAARAYHGMVYDSVREEVLLHGGTIGPGAPSLGDTYAWDGERWTLRSLNGPEVYGFGLAFDPVRGITLLHGGRGNGSPRLILGTTWE